MVSFLRAISDLKSIPRSGWISHGVALHDTESVAEHTFSTCMLSAVMAECEVKRGKHVNVERVLKMALLHDLAEALTFDISKSYLEYLGNRGRSIKNEIEKAAWRQLLKALEPFGLTEDYASLHTEYFRGRTVESQIVHAADGLDILLQVINLRRRGYAEFMLKELWDMTSRTLDRSALKSASKMRSMILREGVDLRRRLR